MIVPLAMDADVIIHEATNAFIKDMESNRCLTEQELERDTTSVSDVMARSNPFFRHFFLIRVSFFDKCSLHIVKLW